MLEEIFEEIEAELERARRIHGSIFNSAHEGIAVLREEYLELEQEVFHGDRDKAIDEALQVAAMAIKLIMHYRLRGY